MVFLMSDIWKIVLCSEKYTELIGLAGGHKPLIKAPIYARQWQGFGQTTRLSVRIMRITWRQIDMRGIASGVGMYRKL